MSIEILSKEIHQRIDQLPPHLLEELLTYVDFLNTKHKEVKKRKLRLNWVGALQPVNANYTALELQKKALDWRSL
jgi:Protein of unknown function (DUF2281)